MDTRTWHRPLVWLAALMVITGLVSVVGYVVDDRMLTGVPIWSKPLQFSISFGLYAVTLAWLIAKLRGPRVHGLASRAGTAIAVAVGLEMTAILMQVLRGQQSHFNYSSPFNATVFAAMGVFVVVIFVATVVVGIALLRQTSVVDRATRLAVGLGLGITVLGMSVGFLMVVPGSSQGSDAAIRGAHSVGGADGGPAVPLTAWSMTAGDLRVPHFVGLHALQVLPLLVVALTALHLTDCVRARLVLVAAAGYVGVFALSLVQALRGQPVTGPDAWTLGGVAALGLALAATTLVVLRHGRASASVVRPRAPLATPY